MNKLQKVLWWIVKPLPSINKTFRISDKHKSLSFKDSIFAQLLDNHVIAKQKQKSLKDVQAKAMFTEKIKDISLEEVHRRYSSCKRNWWLILIPFIALWYPLLTSAAHGKLLYLSAILVCFYNLSALSYFMWQTRLKAFYSLDRFVAHCLINPTQFLPNKLVSNA